MSATSLLSSSLFLVHAASVLGYELPPFDFKGALIVGAIVTLTAAAIIAVAVATPFFALQAGISIGIAVSAITVIALATGVIGGVAAGFYEGNIVAGKQREEIRKISLQSTLFEVNFLTDDSNPGRALPFQCHLTWQDEIDLSAWPPKIQQNRREIAADNGGTFYQLIEHELRNWFAKSILADDDAVSRRVTIYMDPSPGESVYDRLRELVLEKAEQAGRTVSIQRVESSRESTPIPSHEP